MYFLFESFTVPLTLYQFIGGVLVLVIIAIILLWNHIPQKLSKGWHALSDLNETTITTLRADLVSSKEQIKDQERAIRDLMREVDIRKEINSQDTMQIVQLKKDLASLEGSIVLLRRELREEFEKVDGAPNGKP